MISRIYHIFFLLIIAIPLNANVNGVTSQDFGKNRVVLKHNDAKGASKQLKQEMFCKVVNGTKLPCTNTIFVIQSDFELAESITIPDGCVLEFDGGILRNGIINTNGCYIDASLYQIFDNIEFNKVDLYAGSLEVIDNIYIKVLKDNSFINRKTNTLIKANSIVNRRYTYRITGKSTAPLTEKKVVSIIFNGQKYKIAEITPDKKYDLKYDYTHVVGISNSTGEMVSGIVNNLKGITFYAVSPLDYINNSVVKNKEIQPEWFGAKGDNQNDDSYAFNTALDLAYYSDSKVVVGNGVYRIDDALVVHTHTNLVGVVPSVENPANGYFSVNTDIGIIIFDRNNPSGSYTLDSFGFKPFSNRYKYNYTGIKIYHSQNYAKISNIAILNPKQGIEVDAIGGVQTLRCEDISVWCHEDKESVAITAKCRLNGWFNANYFRLSRTAHCGGVAFKAGSNNILDGGACETNTGVHYLISLDGGATLIARGGFYNEEGHFAKLRNSSCLIIEGESFLIGSLDCDNTSYVSHSARNVQTKNGIINNSVVYNDMVKAHYRVFSKMTSLWFETISRKIIRPLELGDDYSPVMYNGRYFTMGYCKIPMDGIDISEKTIAIRVISPAALSSEDKTYPFYLNVDLPQSLSSPRVRYSQARSVSLENTSILYSSEGVSQGSIEKGERYIFIPYGKGEFILNNFASNGNPSFMISDIYVIDRNIQEINKGNEKLRIIDVLNYLDSYVNEEGLLYGYNKGGTEERPINLTKHDEGFEYFDTTLHMPVYWTGDISIGDKGWVDAMGNYPKP